MSRRQWSKLDVVERIELGHMTVAEGAAALGLSRRQMQRVRKRVGAEGQAGVVHGNTARAPGHRTASLIRDRVVALRHDKYVDFNDQHFTEKLHEVEELPLSRETVRRILRAAEIPAMRGRRSPKHRRRRDRRAQAGQMILWDGSRHPWLEDRGPRLCLIAAIDDATGELLPGGYFADQEGSIGYLSVLHAIVVEKGVPLTAYMDRHGSLKRNDKSWSAEEELAGRQEPTQVRRALNELGIQVIYALSPQAKGRVERLWGTLQDRLVSELRLAKATTAAEATKVLEAYLPKHNERFAIAPADANSAWRPCPPGITADEACALQYARRVSNDNTLKIDGGLIEIPRKVGGRPTFAKAMVLVRHLLSGRYIVYCDGEKIAQAKGEPPGAPETRPRTIAAFHLREARVKTWLRLQNRG